MFYVQLAPLGGILGPLKSDLGLFWPFRAIYSRYIIFTKSMFKVWSTIHGIFYVFSKFTYKWTPQAWQGDQGECTGGTWGSRRTSRGSHGVNGEIWWVFWWFLRHIYMPLYQWYISFMWADSRTDGSTEGLQEVLAGLNKVEPQSANFMCYVPQLVS